MRIIARRFVLPLAVAACLGVASGVASGAAAARDFGALATNPQGAWGYAANFIDVNEAQDEALRECRKHGSNCSIVRVFQNVCVAVARNEIRGRAYVSWARGSGREDRVRRALRECRNAGGSDCQILKEFCTGREED